MTQSVMIICYDLEQRNQIQRWLVEANVNLPRVRFFIIPSDDIWTRDYGPLTLRYQEHTKILNFKFNGWGNKYPAGRDNLVVTQSYMTRSYFPASAIHAKLILCWKAVVLRPMAVGSLLTTRIVYCQKIEIPITVKIPN